MSYSLLSRAHCTLFGHRGGQYINHSVNHQDNIKVPYPAILAVSLFNFQVEKVQMILYLFLTDKSM